MDFARAFQKVRTVDATNTSFPSKIPTTTEPTGTGAAAATASVIEVSGGSGGATPSRLLFIPYGTGDANDVFDMKVIGWRRIGSGPPPDTLWVPVTLLGVTCTLGAAVGIASSPVTETRKFVDTITIMSAMEPVITADTTNAGTVVRFSPAGDFIGWVEMPVRGFEKIEFIFDTTTGDPTGANALYAFID